MTEAELQKLVADTRNLNASQRARIAATVVGSPSESRNPDRNGVRVTVDQAAKLWEVGGGSISRARHIMLHGIPDLLGAIDAGRLSVNHAARIASLPREEQVNRIKEIKSNDKIPEHPRVIGQTFCEETALVKEALKNLRRAANVMRKCQRDYGFGDKSMALLRRADADYREKVKEVLNGKHV